MWQLKIENYCNTRLNITMIQSRFQTKEWRASQFWYCNGKKNECEKYQIQLLKDIIGQTNILIGTKFRFNKTTGQLCELTNRDNYLNQKYNFTEDFDCYWETYINNVPFTFLCNLKFICGPTGGAQTRSLELVWDFIQFQKKLALPHHYFINILDGDACHTFKNYIQECPEYIFIGDMYSFDLWWKQVISTNNQ